MHTTGQRCLEQAIAGRSGLSHLTACSAALKRSRGWLVPFGLELELTAPFGWLVQLGWAGLEMEVGRIGHLTLVYTRRQLCRWLFGHRAHVKLLGLYVSGRS